VCLYWFAVVAECAVDLDVEEVKRLSPAMLSEVKDDVEKRICDRYLSENAGRQPNFQLIAFKKFNQRFSAFFMSNSRGDLTKFVKRYFRGQLKQALETIVNDIVSGVRIKRIDWSVKDFDRCDKYFLVGERLRNCSSPSPSFSQTSPSSFDFTKVTLGIYELLLYYAFLFPVRNLILNFPQRHRFDVKGSKFGRFGDTFGDF